jgi:uncharacterized membrane protein YhhN
MLSAQHLWLSFAFTAVLYTALFTQGMGQYSTPIHYASLALKPLPVALLSMVLSSTPTAWSNPSVLYTVWGLRMSAAGDFYLDLSSAFKTVTKEAFLIGLACFFAAHVLYALSNAQKITRHSIPAGLTAMVLPGVVLNLLTPHILGSTEDRQLYPFVLAYCVAISIMLYTALARSQQYYYATAVGGLLFCLSDAVLAFDRFVTFQSPVPWWWRHPKVIVMVLYFSAQAFITVGEGRSSTKVEKKR